MEGMSSGVTMIGRLRVGAHSMSPPCCRSYMLVSRHARSGRRSPLGAGEQLDRADADHLVHDRGERDPGSRHPGDRGSILRSRPRRCGLDVPGGGPHRGDLGLPVPAAPGGVVCRAPRARHELSAPDRCASSPSACRPAASRHAHGGEVAPRQDHGLIQVRHQLSRPRGRDDLAGCPGLGAVQRLRSSSIPASVRATSTPPLWVNTPSSGTARCCPG